jgi:hypothetical protein
MRRRRVFCTAILQNRGRTCGKRKSGFNTGWRGRGHRGCRSPCALPSGLGSEHFLFDSCAQTLSLLFCSTPALIPTEQRNYNTVPKRCATYFQLVRNRDLSFKFDAEIGEFDVWDVVQIEASCCDVWVLLSLGSKQKENTIY